IAGRLLTGCMKWISAVGKSLRTSPTSAIEAQSKSSRAPSPQRPEYTRLGVAFDGIEHIARKPVDKPPRRSGDRRRTQAQQWIGRPRRSDDGIDPRESDAPERAGRDKANFRHRTILQTRRRHAAPRDEHDRSGMTNRGGLARR